MGLSNDSINGREWITQFIRMIWTTGKFQDEINNGYAGSGSIKEDIRTKYKDHLINGCNQYKRRD